MRQLHKKFTDSQVKELMKRYLRGEVKRKYLQEILGIKRRRFFILLEKYRSNPQAFSIQYTRKQKTRAIDSAIEKNILKELRTEQGLIKHKDVPLKSYNYSFIRDQLRDKSKQTVSVPTIISRAKKHGFYLKNPKRKVHDREILANYAGEFIEYDPPHHLFAPNSRKKWYLITSIDDFGQYIFYTKLIKK